MSKLPDGAAARESDYPIEPLFLRRWSPRAMSGETLAPQDLMRLFEAARWAPSTYNEQEWRFLYAFRGSDHWELFFNLLVEANQAWCANAGALIAVLSSRVMSRNGKENPVHSFDCGAAFQNLALQGAAMDLVVHGMAGFDRDKARADLGVPNDFGIEAMAAVGYHGDPESLPEALRDKEYPSGRKPVSDFAREGGFSFS